MKKTETICGDEWLSLKRIKWPEKGINGYTYAREEKSNGLKVAILPYRRVERTYEFLLRKELTPCWDLEKQFVASITGSVETGNIKKHAVQEIEEEGGYTVKEEDLIELGVVFGSKAMDTVYHIFSVDLTDLEQKESKGDGSRLEKEATMFWDQSISKASDPMVYVAHHRLMKWL